MECNKKFLFVLNPIAGGRSKVLIPSEISDFCKYNNCNSRIFETTGKGDAENIEKLYQDIQPDAVVAIGGDGTVNLVANLLVGTETPIGIIPLGSSNGLAKDLGVPLTFKPAFESICRFKIKPIDTLTLNGKHCFHLSDFGFNARVCHRFAESIRRGRISYLWLGFQEFFTYKSFPYQIETQLDKYRGDAFMMIITNANKFGTNVSINPLGEIDDGWFEISILKPFPRIFAPYIFYHLINNTIYKTPYYKIIRCQQATVFNKYHELFHIDGEPMELGEKVEVIIKPKSLKVLLP